MWLDELDKKYNFFKEFEAVFNSYHIGTSKRNPTVFTEIAQNLDVRPQDILFVDDNPSNTDRAIKQGLITHLFKTIEDFLQKLSLLNLL